MNSEAYQLIQELIDNFDSEKETDLELCKKIQKIYQDNGQPEDCREQYAMALAYTGKAWLYGWDGLTENGTMAFIALQNAYDMGDTTILEELGLCYYNGYANPDGSPEQEKALSIWKEGQELGNKDCIFHICVDKVDNDEVDQETIEQLEALSEDYPNACALLYYYYDQEGDEDKAWEWREKAIEMESPLMQQWLEEEKEEEVGEDNWTAPETRSTDMSIFFGGSEDDDDDDDDDEFDGYDDETEAAHPGYPEVGEKYVVIAATDDSFRIVQADAADWRSLPALIGAERCDDMRCQKFREVSKRLGLPGTLLGQLDKDAFRKPHLKLNYHASQWYDGSADLAGAMVICMEDGSYNPFSFTSKEQAQSVIDALCNR